MTWGWDAQWKASNQQIAVTGFPHSQDGEMSVTIAPNGAFIPSDTHPNHKQLLLLWSAKEPIAQGAVSFKMGFTPIGSPKTYWSDEIKIKVIP